MRTQKGCERRVIKPLGMILNSSNWQNFIQKEHERSQAKLCQVQEGNLVIQDLPPNLGASIARAYQAEVGDGAGRFVGLKWPDAGSWLVASWVSIFVRGLIGLTFPIW